MDFGLQSRLVDQQAQDTVRHEVFTRRGALYFGTAHLLGSSTSACGPAVIYRFADFSAGLFASRNATVQQALSVATGGPIGQLQLQRSRDQNKKLGAVTDVGGRFQGYPTGASEGPILNFDDGVALTDFKSSSGQYGRQEFLNVATRITGWVVSGASKRELVTVGNSGSVGIAYRAVLASAMATCRIGAGVPGRRCWSMAMAQRPAAGHRSRPSQRRTRDEVVGC